MTFAKRTHHLQPEGAYEVLARANQLEAAGKEIIHLEIGQPDYATLITSARPESKPSKREKHAIRRQQESRRCAKRSQRMPVAGAGLKSIPMK